MGSLARLMNTVAEMAARLDELRERGLRDWVEELAALHALQVQAQALLDMVMRAAAELGYAPTSPREAAEILTAEGLLSREDYVLVRRVAGLRDIVVHGYAVVDMELVRRIISGREYARLVVLASKILEEAGRRGLDP